MGVLAASVALTRPRGPVGQSAVEDGAGTGTAVYVPMPGTPVDAAAALDGIWRLDALPAVRRRIPRRLDAEAGRRRRHRRDDCLRLTSCVYYRLQLLMS